MAKKILKSLAWVAVISCVHGNLWMGQHKGRKYVRN